MYYVYAYLDPRKPGRYFYPSIFFDYEPFYIGKGKNDRLYFHKWVAADLNDHSYKSNKIRKIEQEGGEVLIVKVIENLNEQRAFDHEINLIKTIGRLDLKTGPLLNLTDGGEGSGNLNPEILTARNAAVSRGNMGIRVGRKLPEEWKDKISAGGYDRYKKRYDSFTPAPDLRVELVESPTRGGSGNGGWSQSRKGSTNGNAKYYYILISPDGEQIFVERGCLKHKCVELGIGEWSMRNSAQYYEKHDKLFVCEKNANRGWSAVRFKKLSENPIVCNNGQSAAKPAMQEGSTTIPSGSTLQAIGSGSGEPRVSE